MTKWLKRVPVLRKDLMRDNPRGHLYPVDDLGYVRAQRQPLSWWARVVEFVAGDLPEYVVVCQRCGHQEDRWFVVARSHRVCPDAPDARRSQPITRDDRLLLDYDD